MLNSTIVWTPESLDFFEQAVDHSLILDMIVSPLDPKHTESFETLVNALNSQEIFSKIKTINIMDSSYLHRHFYSDIVPSSAHSPSIWYLSNKDTLKKLKADFSIIQWEDAIASPDFQNSKTKILQEYYGVDEATSVDLKFRDLVTAEAAINSFQHDSDISKALKFVFEQCACLCSKLLGENLICHKYPSPPLMYLIRKNSLSINFLRYTVPSFENTDQKKHKAKEEISRTEIESAVTNFMKNEVTNLNFFVTDINGKLIYSNFALEKLIDRDLLAKDIDATAWESTRNVMLTGKTFIGEEARDNGLVYLSMKSPLLINGKIKGAIGLSIDITDSKRVEEARKRTLDLEFLSRLQQVKLNFQDEFTQFISQMAHDITSPLASLEVFTKSCQQLTIPQQFLLSSISANIKSIADDLLKKYRYNKRELDASKKQTLMISVALVDIINQKILQYEKNNVKISLSYDQSAALSAFINMDQSSFSRMISNLVNNAVEACKEKSSDECGIINVKFTTNNHNAIIEVLDNGNGMSQEMINDLKAHIPLKTTKKKGFGLGLCQVLENVKLYHGEISVDSKIGEKSQFKVMFPLQKKPEWITYQVTLKPQCTVLAIDDGTGALSNTSKTFLKNNFYSCGSLRIFDNNSDFEKYVSCLSDSEKEKVFIFMEYRIMNNNSEEILNIILRYNLMTRSLIITDACNDKRLQEFVEISKGKIVPKLFLHKLKVTYG